MWRDLGAREQARERRTVDLGAGRAGGEHIVASWTQTWTQRSGTSRHLERRRKADAWEKIKKLKRVGLGRHYPAHGPANFKTGASTHPSADSRSTVLSLPRRCSHHCLFVGL